MFRKSSFSSARNGPSLWCVEVDKDFKKASFSPPLSPFCVQAKREETIVAVRDSKNPDGPVLEFTKSS